MEYVLTNAVVSFSLACGWKLVRALCFSQKCKCRYVSNNIYALYDYIVGERVAHNSSFSSSSFFHSMLFLPIMLYAIHTLTEGRCACMCVFGIGAFPNSCLHKRPNFSIARENSMRYFTHSYAHTHPMKRFSSHAHTHTHTHPIRIVTGICDVYEGM